MKDKFGSLLAWDMRDLVYSIDEEGQMRFEGDDTQKQAVARQLGSTALLDFPVEWGSVRPFLYKINEPFKAVVWKTMPRNNPVRKSLMRIDMWTMSSISWGVAQPKAVTCSSVTIGSPKASFL